MNLLSETGTSASEGSAPHCAFGEAPEKYSCQFLRVTSRILGQNSAPGWTSLLPATAVPPPSPRPSLKGQGSGRLCHYASGQPPGSCGCRVNISDVYFITTVSKYKKRV